MPRTLKPNQVARSQSISYRKKGGKFIASSDDVTDEMRLAQKLGIVYSGETNLEDAINNRLAELGISMDFIEEREALQSSEFGSADAPGSLGSSSGFSYSEERPLQRVESLNSLDRRKIASIARATTNRNRGDKK